MTDRHYPKIIVRFRIFGEATDWASRTWWAAPRLGDHVILGAGKDRFPPDHNGDAIFKVVAVVWGAETSDESDRYWQRVIVMIEHVEGISRA